jgi:F-type H+-transporting ATPase subunit a
MAEHNLFEHVQDQVKEWEISQYFQWKIQLPEPIPGHPITKFMILEVIAAALVAIVFIPLARRAARGNLPKGPWWNLFEAFLTFIRDDVAKPNLGEHDADRFVPFLWTLFVFILFMNLMGMIPFLGSPTGSLAVTGGLAIVSFLMIHGAAIAKMGGLHYLQSLWPHLDLPIYARLPIGTLIFVIELISSVIKSFVLAVRLFANMFAGHMVLSTILGFIVMAANLSVFLWIGVTGASVAGVVALSLLELFVAFLQAYIFVFLTALFIGMAIHPAH